MEAYFNKIDKLIENHEKALNLLLRNQKILAENHSDLEKQMDVEVQHLQQQIDVLSVPKKKGKKDKKSKKDKKAGKKEKKKNDRSDRSTWKCNQCNGPYTANCMCKEADKKTNDSDDDLKLASWRDQRVC